ncbi:hypothetical protein [Pseudobdellovibrio sp. HCB154]|uniref:hypothetical protein n=1 Tax=Pseudobdellovibrio sp. HCB154 TaxID=3386277 RepID=UPI0039172450
MKTLMTINVFLNVLFMNIPAHAKEFNLKWSEVRFFLSDTTFANKDENLGALMQAEQIEELKKVTGFGLEVDAELSSWFKAGTKIKGVFNGSNKKEAPFPATEYLSVQQYSAGLTGRVMLVNKENFFFDVFGELGLSNNTVELRTTMGNAKWDKNSHFYQRAGASTGFGGSSFKMFVEGGYENFKLDNLKHEGAIGQNINEIDLSGPYVSVGLIISGLPSWIKPGGLSIGGK